MKVFIVYCHPYAGSFTRSVLDSFTEGLDAAGHEYVISDLYAMNFSTDMTIDEYLRETNYAENMPVPSDVAAEQQKLQESDAVVFVYPVFWTEAPAKLVGWFDRVWTVGFAYGEKPAMKRLKKALCLVCAGKTMQRLEECGEIEAMERVMLGDRIHDRAEHKEMIIFDGITKAAPEQCEVLTPMHLSRAYCAGRDF